MSQLSGVSDVLGDRRPTVSTGSMGAVTDLAELLPSTRADGPAHTLLLVPVGASPHYVSLCIAQRPDGTRVGIAFTSPAALTSAGHGQRWILLAESALRSQLQPLGIANLQLDALLVAPGLRDYEPSSARR